VGSFAVASDDTLFSSDDTDSSGGLTQDLSENKTHNQILEQAAIDVQRLCKYMAQLSNESIAKILYYVNEDFLNDFINALSIIKPSINQKQVESSYEEIISIFSNPMWGDDISSIFKFIDIDEDFVGILRGMPSEIVGKVFLELYELQDGGDLCATVLESAAAEGVAFAEDSSTISENSMNNLLWIARAFEHIVANNVGDSGPGLAMIADATKFVTERFNEKIIIDILSQITAVENTKKAVKAAYADNLQGAVEEVVKCYGTERSGDASFLFRILNSDEQAEILQHFVEEDLIDIAKSVVSGMQTEQADEVLLKMVPKQAAVILGNFDTIPSNILDATISKILDTTAQDYIDTAIGVVAKTPITSTPENPSPPDRMKNVLLGMNDTLSIVRMLDALLSTDGVEVNISTVAAMITHALSDYSEDVIDIFKDKINNSNWDAILSQLDPEDAIIILKNINLSTKIGDNFAIAEATIAKILNSILPGDSISADKIILDDAIDDDRKKNILKAMENTVKVALIIDSINDGLGTTTEEDNIVNRLIEKFGYTDNEEVGDDEKKEFVYALGILQHTVYLNNIHNATIAKIFDNTASDHQKVITEIMSKLKEREVAIINTMSYQKWLMWSMLDAEKFLEIKNEDEFESVLKEMKSADVALMLNALINYAGAGGAERAAALTEAKKLIYMYEGTSDRLTADRTVSTLVNMMLLQSGIKNTADLLLLIEESRPDKNDDTKIDIFASLVSSYYNNIQTVAAILDEDSITSDYAISALKKIQNESKPVLQLIEAMKQNTKKNTIQLALGVDPEYLVTVDMDLIRFFINTFPSLDAGDALNNLMNQGEEFIATFLSGINANDAAGLLWLLRSAKQSEVEAITSVTENIPAYVGYYQEIMNYYNNPAVINSYTINIFAGIGKVSIIARVLLNIAESKAEKALEILKGFSGNLAGIGKKESTLISIYEGQLKAPTSTSSGGISDSVFESIFSSIPGSIANGCCILACIFNKADIANAAGAAAVLSVFSTAQSVNILNSSVMTDEVATAIVNGLANTSPPQPPNIAGDAASILLAMLRIENNNGRSAYILNNVEQNSMFNILKSINNTNDLTLIYGQIQPSGIYIFAKALNSDNSANDLNSALEILHRLTDDSDIMDAKIYKILNNDMVTTDRIALILNFVTDQEAANVLHNISNIQRTISILNAMNAAKAIDVIQRDEYTTDLNNICTEQSGLGLNLLTKIFKNNVSTNTRDITAVLSKISLNANRVNVLNAKEVGNFILSASEIATILNQYVVEHEHNTSSIFSSIVQMNTGNSRAHDILNNIDKANAFNILKDAGMDTSINALISNENETLIADILTYNYTTATGEPGSVDDVVAGAVNIINKIAAVTNKAKVLNNITETDFIAKILNNISTGNISTYLNIFSNINSAIAINVMVNENFLQSSLNALATPNNLAVISGIFSSAIADAIADVANGAEAVSNIVNNIVRILRKIVSGEIETDITAQSINDIVAQILINMTSENATLILNRFQTIDEAVVVLNKIALVESTSNLPKTIGIFGILGNEANPQFVANTHFSHGALMRICNIASGQTLVAGILNSYMIASNIENILAILRKISNANENISSEDDGLGSLVNVLKIVSLSEATNMISHLNVDEKIAVLVYMIANNNVSLATKILNSNITDAYDIVLGLGNSVGNLTAVGGASVTANKVGYDVIVGIFNNELSNNQNNEATIIADITQIIRSNSEVLLGILSRFVARYSALTLHNILNGINWEEESMQNAAATEKLVHDVMNSALMDSAKAAEIIAKEIQIAETPAEGTYSNFAANMLNIDKQKAFNIINDSVLSSYLATICEIPNYNTVIDSGNSITYSKSTKNGYDIIAAILETNHNSTLAPSILRKIANPSETSNITENSTNLAIIRILLANSNLTDGNISAILNNLTASEVGVIFNSIKENNADENKIKTFLLGMNKEQAVKVLADEKLSWALLNELLSGIPERNIVDLFNNASVAQYTAAALWRFIWESAIGAENDISTVESQCEIVAEMLNAIPVASNKQTVASNICGNFKTNNSLNGDEVISIIAPSSATTYKSAFVFYKIITNIKESGIVNANKVATLIGTSRSETPIPSAYAGEALYLLQILNSEEIVTNILNEISPANAATVAKRRENIEKYLNSRILGEALNTDENDDNVLESLINKLTYSDIVEVLINANSASVKQLLSVYANLYNEHKAAGLLWLISARNQSLVASIVDNEWEEQNIEIHYKNLVGAYNSEATNYQDAVVVLRNTDNANMTALASFVESDDVLMVAEILKTLVTTAGEQEVEGPGETETNTEINIAKLAAILKTAIEHPNAFSAVENAAYFIWALNDADLFSQIIMEINNDYETISEILKEITTANTDNIGHVVNALWFIEEAAMDEIAEPTEEDESFKTESSKFSPIINSILNATREIEPDPILGDSLVQDTKAYRIAQGLIARKKIKLNQQLDDTEGHAAIIKAAIDMKAYSVAMSFAKTIEIDSFIAALSALEEGHIIKLLQNMLNIHNENNRYDAAGLLWLIKQIKETEFINSLLENDTWGTDNAWNDINDYYNKLLSGVTTDQAVVFFNMTGNTTENYLKIGASIFKKTETAAPPESTEAIGNLASILKEMQTIASATAASSMSTKLTASRLIRDIYQYDIENSENLAIEVLVATTTSSNYSIIVGILNDMTDSGTMNNILKGLSTSYLGLAVKVLNATIRASIKTATAIENETIKILLDSSIAADSNSLDSDVLSLVNSLYAFDSGHKLAQVSDSFYDSEDGYKKIATMFNSISPSSFINIITKMSVRSKEQTNYLAKVLIEVNQIDHSFFNERPTFVQLTENILSQLTSSAAVSLDDKKIIFALINKIYHDSTIQKIARDILMKISEKCAMEVLNVLACVADVENPGGGGANAEKAAKLLSSFNSTEKFANIVNVFCSNDNDYQNSLALILAQILPPEEGVNTEDVPSVETICAALEHLVKSNDSGNEYFANIVGKIEEINPAKAMRIRNRNTSLDYANKLLLSVGGLTVANFIASVENDLITGQVCDILTDKSNGIAKVWEILSAINNIQGMVSVLDNMSKVAIALPNPAGGWNSQDAACLRLLMTNQGAFSNTIQTDFSAQYSLLSSYESAPRVLNATAHKDIAAYVLYNMAINSATAQDAIKIAGALTANTISGFEGFEVGNKINISSSESKTGIEVITAILDNVENNTSANAANVIINLTDGNKVNILSGLTGPEAKVLILNALPPNVVANILSGMVNTQIAIDDLLKKIEAEKAIPAMIENGFTVLGQIAPATIAKVINNAITQESNIRQILRKIATGNVNTLITGNVLGIINILADDELSENQGKVLGYLEPSEIAAILSGMDGNLPNTFIVKIIPAEKIIPTLQSMEATKRAEIMNKVLTNSIINILADDKTLALDIMGDGNFSGETLSNIYSYSGNAGIEFLADVFISCIGTPAHIAAVMAKMTDSNIVAITDEMMSSVLVNNIANILFNIDKSNTDTNTLRLPGIIRALLGNNNDNYAKAANVLKPMIDLGELVQSNNSEYKRGFTIVGEALFAIESAEEMEGGSENAMLLRPIVDNIIHEFSEVQGNELKLYVLKKKAGGLYLNNVTENTVIYNVIETLAGAVLDIVNNNSDAVYRYIMRHSPQNAACLVFLLDDKLANGYSFQISSEADSAETTKYQAINTAYRRFSASPFAATDAILILNGASPNVVFLVLKKMPTDNALATLTETQPTFENLSSILSAVDVKVEGNTLIRGYDLIAGIFDSEISNLDNIGSLVNKINNDNDKKEILLSSELSSINAGKILAYLPTNVASAIVNTILGNQVITEVAVDTGKLAGILEEIAAEANRNAAIAKLLIDISPVHAVRLFELAHTAAAVTLEYWANSDNDSENPEGFDIAVARMKDLGRLGAAEIFNKSQISAQMAAKTAEALTTTLSVFEKMIGLQYIDKMCQILSYMKTTAAITILDALGGSNTISMASRVCMILTEIEQITKVGDILLEIKNIRGIVPMVNVLNEMPIISPVSTAASTILQSADAYSVLNTQDAACVLWLMTNKPNPLPRGNIGTYYGYIADTNANVENIADVLNNTKNKDIAAYVLHKIFETESTTSRTLSMVSALDNNSLNAIADFKGASAIKINSADEEGSIAKEGMDVIVDTIIIEEENSYAPIAMILEKLSDNSNRIKVLEKARGLTNDNQHIVPILNLLANSSVTAAILDGMIKNNSAQFVIAEALELLKNMEAEKAISAMVDSEFTVLDRTDADTIATVINKVIGGAVTDETISKITNILLHMEFGNLKGIIDDSLTELTLGTMAGILETMTSEGVLDENDMPTGFVLVGKALCAMDTDDVTGNVFSISTRVNNILDAFNNSQTKEKLREYILTEKCHGLYLGEVEEATNVRTIIESLTGAKNNREGVYTYITNHSIENAACLVYLLNDEHGYDFETPAPVAPAAVHESINEAYGKLSASPFIAVDAVSVLNSALPNIVFQILERMPTSGAIAILASDGFAHLDYIAAQKDVAVKNNTISGIDLIARIIDAESGSADILQNISLINARIDSL
jgi:hypothetical protein